MSAIEIKRIQKALGVGQLNNFDEIKHFFGKVMEIVIGKFMKYSFSMPENNLIRGEWQSCFAYEGIKALSVIDRYECGIMLRIETWFDTLGIKYTVKPKVTGCMIHSDGQCFRDYRFFLKNKLRIYFYGTKRRDTETIRKGGFF